MTHLNTSVVITQGKRKYISTNYPTWFLLEVVSTWKTEKIRLKKLFKHLLNQNDFVEWSEELKNDNGIEYGNIHYFPNSFKGEY